MSNATDEQEFRLPPEAFNTAKLKRELRKAILRKLTYDRYPKFWEALKEDVRLYSAIRGEPRQLDTPLAVLKGALDLTVDTDAFLGVALYRARTRLLALGVPIVPELIHRICIACFQISIGEPVVIAPGFCILHGQVVMDGNITVGKNVTVAPWVTIGLSAGCIEGPKIGDGVQIGTGAKLIGDIRVGVAARIGANAVVVKDVPAGATARGVPARTPSPSEDT